MFNAHETDEHRLDVAPRIVVAVDGSKANRAAVPWAAETAIGAALPLASVQRVDQALRTPMTGTLGAAALLLMDGLTGEQERVTRKLQHSARLLPELLNDILDFSNF